MAYVPLQELKPWIDQPPHSTPPELPGYQQVAHVQLSIGKISIVGLLLIPVWVVVFTGSVGLLGGRTSYEGTASFSVLLLFIAALVGITLVHEAIHGLAAALLGAKPSFGVGPGFAYTTFLEPMSKLAYLTVGLAPLIIISAAAITVALAWPALAGWAIIIGVTNAAGAIGDLWMTAIILRHPRQTMFFDLADGFAVYAPNR